MVMLSMTMKCLRRSDRLIHSPLVVTVEHMSFCAKLFRQDSVNFMSDDENAARPKHVCSGGAALVGSFAGSFYSRGGGSAASVSRRLKYP